jgi:hypothetical protein
MNGLNIKVDVNIIPLGSYDFLIGMDWLEKHHDVLDCYNKTITCLDEEGKQDVGCFDPCLHASFLKLGSLDRGYI